MGQDLDYLRYRKIGSSMHTLWRQVEFWLGKVSKDKINISDSETIFGIAYKNSIIDSDFFDQKENIQKKPRKMTNIAD